MKTRPNDGRVAVALVMSLLLCACGPQKTVIMVPEKDPGMDAAIQRARSEVAAFVARLKNPDPKDKRFGVKAALRDGEQVEHFWLDDVSHENGLFRGKLGNEPELVKGHTFGEAVVVAEKDISDWMYVHDGILVGGYTVRLLRDRMEPKDRERLDRQLDFRVQ
jgi:uncharacterized protein YegJ (DUF2314 family)